jgi:activating signal cointegrator complex subunit 2
MKQLYAAHCSSTYCRSENADTVLRDKSFANDMKADILRRVREQAEEEEEAEREARGGVLGKVTAPATVTVAFEEELSDADEEAAGAGSIKLGGNAGEAIDEEEDDAAVS